jgi:hypothetical protein
MIMGRKRQIVPISAHDHETATAEPPRARESRSPASGLWPRELLQIEPNWLNIREPMTKIPNVPHQSPPAALPRNPNPKAQPVWLNFL